jgi:DMSO/TMAO reductase YedYZ heme-binding membrane subunit
MRETLPFNGYADQVAGLYHGMDLREVLLMSATIGSPGFLRLLLVVNAGVPMLLLGYDTARGQLGTNPPEYLIRTTGMLTLIMMVITLTITPAMRWTATPALIQVRRLAGAVRLCLC